ncbi:BTAD domain-containing putative transcriptional regulator [Frankia sp. ACN1ag]|uniref:AfsR/SARP family transcriptional regulator n=1 Tax=Frankia sp. ACN1ag TaxID=102891 RepID=UPI0037BF157E
MHSLLAQAHPVGVSGLLTGAALTGVHVAADGSLRADRIPQLRRAFTLTAAATLRLLTPRPAGTEVTIPLVSYRPPPPRALPKGPTPPPPSPAVSPGDGNPDPHHPPAAIPPHTDHPPPPSRVAGDVQVVTFGRPHLELDGVPVYHGLLSMEIAAYLAVHRAGVTTATLVDQMLPDADPARAKDQIYQAVRRLRDACGQAAGGAIAIANGKGGYRLTLHGGRCDLWEFHQALHDANHAPDDPTRRAALRRAAGLYRGRFCGDLDAPWAAGHATTLEHQAIDAYQDLADLLADDDPTQAAVVLEQALTTTDPSSEPLHTHLMRLHARTGHLTEVRRVYDRLVARLADLDAQPSPATIALLPRLLRTTRP